MPDPARLARVAALAWVGSVGIGQAQVADGTYQIGECGPAAAETRMILQGGTAGYLESLCTLADPVAIRGMPGATLFDVTCTGEGTTWSYRALFAPLADGRLIVLREGYAFEYLRCG